MTAVLTALAELLFPSLCLSCGRILLERRGHPFCSGCYSGIRFITAPLCPVCGIPYPVEDSPDHTCGDCLLFKRNIGAARSLGIYDSVLLDAIHAFKYGGNLTLGERLGRLMADHDYPSFRIGDYSLLIPVPLHPRRLRQRGFNQSVILAREIAKRHGIAMEFRTLRRVVDTESQAGLKKEERRSNIRKAFSVTEPDRVSEKHVLLIDDVYTTGSTLGECARTLLKGGAESVGALTLARAIQEPL
ncbi:MAG TPA: ComF family protein [Syntrophales bacterium]